MRNSRKHKDEVADLFPKGLMTPTNQRDPPKVACITTNQIIKSVEGKAARKTPFYCAFPSCAGPRNRQSPPLASRCHSRPVRIANNFSYPRVTVEAAKAIARAM